MEERVIQFFDQEVQDYSKFNEASIGQTLYMILKECSDVTPTEKVLQSAKSWSERYFKWARANNVRTIGVTTRDEYEKMIQNFFDEFQK